LHAVVDVPRTGPFQISDPVANQNDRRNPHSEMHVILDASNGVHLHASGLHGTSAQILMQAPLDLAANHGSVIFCVKGDVEIALGVAGAGHARLGGRAAAETRKSRESGAEWGGA